MAALKRRKDSCRVLWSAVLKRSSTSRRGLWPVPLERKGVRRVLTPPILPSVTSIVRAIVACWSTSFPTSFPTFVVVCILLSHESINIEISFTWFTGNWLTSFTTQVNSLLLHGTLQALSPFSISQLRTRTKLSQKSSYTHKLILQY